MARRSVLFTPGDRPDRMRTAPDLGADVIVFDLEDAVVPDRKSRAREDIGEVLAEIDADAEVCVRVNPPELGASEDLASVLGGAGPDAIVQPKAESAAAVGELAGLIADHGTDLPVLALVETATGVLRADAIAAADPTDALLFGAEDLAADLGATRSDEGTEVLYARERVVLAAAAAGIDAIDTLYTDFEDTDGLAADASFAVELGYDGKMAIHPAQVPVIHEAFRPDPDELEWAESVLAASESADAAVFEVDGEMIDAPLLARAERIVERAGGAASDE
ncbi:MAG: CoA ester lyase [Salinirussus sp.]